VLKTLAFDRFYERGEGAYLYDDRGDRYLDLLSGFGVFALGRSHPVIKKALHDAIDADLPNLVQIDCALLPAFSPKPSSTGSHKGIERVFFCNSGAEAIEAAIKFARQSTHRSRILYCDHAYHGLTNGALSLNGGDDFRKGFGPLLRAPTASPSAISGPSGAHSPGATSAAFVAEPIQGKGVYLAPRATGRRPRRSAGSRAPSS